MPGYLVLSMQTKHTGKKHNKSKGHKILSSKFRGEPEELKISKEKVEN